MDKYEQIKQLQATRILCQDEAACHVMDEQLAKLMEPPPMPNAIVVDTTELELSE